MKMTLFGAFVAVLIACGSPLRSQEAPAADPALAGLVREALENNPGLEAAMQRARAAEKAVPQAGALPDPQLTVGLMNLPVNSFDFDQEPMTGKLISLMQTFPFPGKLSLAKGVAESEAAAVGLEREEVRNQIVQMVTRAYYDLYAADRAVETVERNKALMEQFVRVAETKYATGSGLQQDVLRAQVERSKLDDDLLMWRAKRAAAAARLNALLNRPAGAPFDVTPEDAPLPQDSLPLLTPSQIETMRPLLRAWRERIRKADTALKLAQRDRWPTFTLGASYTQRDNLKSGATMYDFFSATLSLNIPIYFANKQGARVAEADLKRAAAAAEYERVRADAMAEVESLRAELERERKRVQLYRGGILIQARQSLESARAGYEAGKVDFLTLINNWMMVESYELQSYFALADYHKAMASYELAVGSEPPADE
jgi:cobalt-zinc-cadmium efflux system outer membrane protein